MAAGPAAARLLPGPPGPARGRGEPPRGRDAGRRGFGGEGAGCGPRGGHPAPPALGPPGLGGAPWPGPGPGPAAAGRQSRAPAERAEERVGRCVLGNRSAGRGEGAARANGSAGRRQLPVFSGVCNQVSPCRGTGSAGRGLFSSSMRLKPFPSASGRTQANGISRRPSKRRVPVPGKEVSHKTLLSQSGTESCFSTTVSCLLVEMPAYVPAARAPSPVPGTLPRLHPTADPTAAVAGAAPAGVAAGACQPWGAGPPASPPGVRLSPPCYC